MWRILQAPGAWATRYNERIKRFGHVKGAIIFPEQLLGLNQKYIYMVVTGATFKSVTVTIEQVAGWSFDSNKHANVIHTIGDVYEYEQRFEPNTLRIKSGSSGGGVFMASMLFTSVKNALVCANSEMKSLASKFG